MRLRNWVQKSGWLETDPTKLQVSPEDDATSFGQQVPILLTFLTVFTAAQTVNVAELWDKRRIVHSGHGAKPQGKLSQSDFQEKPPGPPDIETTGQYGTRLLNQRLWEAEGHTGTLLPYQPAADHIRMVHPDRPPCNINANTTPSNANEPGNRNVISPGSSSFVEGTDALDFSSPASSGAGNQSPLRQTSSATPPAHNLSNQAALLNPDLRTGVMCTSEPKSFLPYSPPQSNANPSGTTAYS
ncbi:hypothetical protein KVR01_001782 [Diaporthe batatas]|uniref:uncharacterized protein n=1 Tax=Diaporthe batatas TaxID=748121 RepID=UPI001D055204|nr:uncharacterized protein KVR01_001782 [Diaporthe batatas]KAG8169033.1 hypothetical protein KVR01_001782 [Diaporthe batatas]